MAAPSQWLVQRLNNMKYGYIRYEASFYGPVNSFLNKLYDSDQNFLVKAQPRLRSLETAPNARTSIDSNDQPVQRRDDDPIPDFVVVKGTEDLHADVPFLIIEVKNQHVSFGAGASQTDRYDGWARDYLNQAYNKDPVVPKPPRFLYMMQIFGSTAWISTITKDVHSIDGQGFFVDLTLMVSHKLVQNGFKGRVVVGVYK
ncbi:uncharacterized protein STEHIDRAFT_116079 [Stereum hirsutum FP-91666 SS1]|uniref:Uncharacterized protein n=1 Tax=Stereum hirsutum (strain FP-91666) TaxID=721885 RepID=R7RZ90_STEHR|nr:uncharacterized protein STEHIDRAFT_116079 [Stereum hirsutum FP-91666 SS1]EIM80240.1 hypothetical protein STEHIDRAFT_116079 [Stereum hirsutum FP-91666 SS1]